MLISYTWKYYEGIHEIFFERIAANFVMEIVLKLLQYCGDSEFSRKRNHPWRDVRTTYPVECQVTSDPEWICIWYVSGICALLRDVNIDKVTEFLTAQFTRPITLKKAIYTSQVHPEQIFEGSSIVMIEDLLVGLLLNKCQKSILRNL